MRNPEGGNCLKPSHQAAKPVGLKHCKELVGAGIKDFW